MRSSNPAFNNSTFKQLAPQPYGAVGGPYAVPETRTDLFTVNGVIIKTVALLMLVGASAYAAIVIVPASVRAPVMLGSVALGFVVAVALMFKPNLAPVLAPVYAIVEGTAMGVITQVLNQAYPGVALNALVATFAVFAVMLVLYRSGVIKVNDTFRTVVIGATFGIMAFYLVRLVGHVAGISIGFSATDGSLLSIGVSLAVIVVAALNLALDFDFIDRAGKAGLPERSEWYGAFALIVTIVWLYFELLRLFTKLAARD